MLGFPELEEGMYIQPDNLGGGVEGVRASLRRLSSEAGALVCRVDELSERDEGRARSLWDVETLAGTYIDLRERMRVTNGLLFGLLWALGQPALYLLWAGAWLTTNKLIVRVRSMAEHARVPNPSPGDPFGNTRTTPLSWWERLFLAPHNVGYHLEHHLVITVPQYNLPRFHRLLRERGVLDEACIAKGFPEVLRRWSPDGP